MQKMKNKNRNREKKNKKFTYIHLLREADTYVGVFGVIGFYQYRNSMIFYRIQNTL